MPLSKQEFATLIEKGLNQAEIARISGCTRQAVKERLNRYQGLYKQYKYKKEEKKLLAHKERVSYKWKYKKASEQFYKKKQYCKERGIDFTITPWDLTYPEYCPVFGIKLQWGQGNGISENSPSLDRLDPNKGYIPGNVQYMSWRANRIKNNATLEEMEKLYNWYKKQVSW